MNRFYHCHLASHGDVIAADRAHRPAGVSGHVLCRPLRFRGGEQGGGPPNLRIACPIGAWRTDPEVLRHDDIDGAAGQVRLRHAAHWCRDGYTNDASRRDRVPAKGYQHDQQDRADMPRVILFGRLWAVEWSSRHDPLALCPELSEALPEGAGRRGPDIHRGREDM